jgi:hypothetical protein
MKIQAPIVSILFSSYTVSAWTFGPSSDSRRSFLAKTLSKSMATIGALTILSQPSNASSIPTQTELSKLQKGHARVQYLLKNWDDITSVCNKGVMSDLERKQVIRTEGGGGTGNFCQKDPLKVQDFLGYKSTTDPLFKADKLMVNAGPLVDPNDFEDYLDLVEKYREKADQGAMMAYTSSWGEANPGGGKEVIDEYLDRTKDEVVETEKILRKILGFLKLEVLEASKK